MKKRSIKYVASAVNSQGWPQSKKIEILMVGRSNAGKSSLINALWGHPVAFVSGQPGKTNLLNFYELERYMVVDSPGYGYARKNSTIKEGFKAVEEYLLNRNQLGGLLLVVDVRRGVESEEKWLSEFCQKEGVAMALALNKNDKLNRKEAREQGEVWSSMGVPMFDVSALTGTGIAQLESWVFKNWVAGVEK